MFQSEIYKYKSALFVFSTFFLNSIFGEKNKNKKHVEMNRKSNNFDKENEIQKQSNMVVNLS